MNGQTDYSEATAIIIILFVAGLLYLYTYHFEYFVYIWIWPITAFYYALKYIPSIISDTIFFWTHTSVQHDASVIVDNFINPLFFGGEYKGELLPQSLSERFVIFSQSKPRIYTINSYSGYLLNPYVMIYLLWKGIKILNKKKYTSAHSMETLAIQESELWPQIKPVIFDNPLRNPDLDSGDWAMAQKPEYFVNKYKLSKSYENELGETRFTLLEEKTFKVFLNQLGDPWKDVKSLNQYERQIFAIFIAQAMRDGDSSLKLRQLLGNYYTSEKSFKIYMKKRKIKKEIDKLVSSIIKKYAEEDYIKEIINKHFYVKTVFAGLLEKARIDGVLANSDFLWLKIRQRDLWYILSNVGRKSAFVESAGVWSHFMSEQYIERKISNPMVKNAVKALDQYLFESSESYDPITKKEED